jgi:TolA-binding protein
MTDLDPFYRVLDLEPGASTEEIKRAWRDLTKVWHPDRFQGDPRMEAKAEEKLKEINEAFGRLVAGLASQAPRSRPDFRQHEERVDSPEPAPGPEAPSPSRPAKPGEPFPLKGVAFVVLLFDALALILLFAYFRPSPAVAERLFKAVMMFALASWGLTRAIPPLKRRGAAAGFLLFGSILLCGVTAFFTLLLPDWLRQHADKRLYQEAVAYSTRREFKEAEALLRDYVQREPLDPAAYAQLGNALAGQERFEEAVTSYRRAVAISPSYSEAYRGVGWALEELGRFQEAQPALMEALRLNPADGFAHGVLGFLSRANSGRRLLGIVKPTSAVNVETRSRTLFGASASSGPFSFTRVSRERTALYHEATETAPFKVHTSYRKPEFPGTARGRGC